MDKNELQKSCDDIREHRLKELENLKFIQLQMKEKQRQKQRHRHRVKVKIDDDYTTHSRRNK